MQTLMSEKSILVFEELERLIKNLEMKKYILMMLFYLLFLASSFGQNNYIYNGGQAQGFAFSLSAKVINSSIFSGNSEDGFNHLTYAVSSQFWSGGSDDGWGSILFSTNVSSIYAGGLDDGMDFGFFQDDLNGSIFRGHDEDGFSSHIMLSIMDGLVFDGGENDGFGYSEISKLIWDGDLNSDWLMADNWNIPMVPTFSHSVCIPNAVPNYPKLTGVLNIALKEDHTYICSEINIFSGAVVKGLEGTRVVVNGRLIVLGDLLIKSSGTSLIEGREDGLIQIQSGGIISVED